MIFRGWPVSSGTWSLEPSAKAIAFAHENERTLALRGRMLKVAMSLLAASAVLIGVGPWLD